MKTPRYVVDASVIAKWVLPGEPYQGNALKLKEDCTSQLVDLHAPSFIMLEVANALWRAAKAGRVSEEDALEALRALEGMMIEIHETKWSEVRQGLTIACSLDLTIYDAVYLTLAHALKTRLITADKRLYETARARFPLLYLGDYL